MELFKTLRILPVPCMNIMEYEYVIMQHDMLVTSLMIHINSYLYIDCGNVSSVDLSRSMNEKYINIQYNSGTGIVINSETCPTILRGVHLFLSRLCVCAGVGGSF